MRALVTGHDQGLGKQIFYALQAAGFWVDGIKGSVLKASKGNKWVVQKQVQDRISDTAFGRDIPFDVVINNYGINHLSWIGTTPAEDQQILDINVMVPYWVIDKLAQTQKEHQTHVINIASQTARVPQRCTALYCASKAAIVQMTKVVAREMAPHWQVNSVSPGKIIGTPMTELTDSQVLELRGWDAEMADAYAESLIPMARFTDSIEVTGAIMRLLDMPNYVTGINLEVMGGV